MELREVLTPAEISAAVKRLASRINRDYKGKRPVVIAVLKGSFIFAADLVRRLKPPVTVDFIRAASYGRGRVSSGKVEITMDVETDIRDRDVIVVEDIMDSGLTLASIVAHLEKKGPGSLRLCVLLDKPSGRKAKLRPDYVGLKVGEGFLVGYGLDLSEEYRNLRGVFEAPGGPKGGAKGAH